MMSIILSVVAILLGLVLVVGLHEFGHFFAARMCKVGIQRVSIGFGKPLLIWRDRHGVQWIWALWPLGGFVELCHTHSHASQSFESHADVSFESKPFYMRVIILLAGIWTNLMVALCALWLVYYVGYMQMNPVIRDVIPNSIFAQAGFRGHERILRVDATETNSWQMVSQLMLMHMKQASVVVRARDRHGDTHTYVLNLKHWHLPSKSESFLMSLGIIVDDSLMHQHHVLGVSFADACHKAWEKLVFLSHFCLFVFKSLVTGALPLGLLLGPVGLLIVMANSLSQSVVIFLGFIANLSVSVAFFNLLPMPGLDGAAIVYAVVERVFKISMSQRVEWLLLRLTFIGLGLLMLQLVIHDLSHLV